jgi:hypothetical protein
MSRRPVLEDYHLYVPRREAELEGFYVHELLARRFGVEQHRVPTVLLHGLLGLTLNDRVVRAQFARALSNAQKYRCENAQPHAVGVEEFQRRQRTWRVAADCSKSAAVRRTKHRRHSIPACVQKAVALANALINLADVREGNSLRYNTLGDVLHLSWPLFFQQMRRDTSAGRLDLLELRPSSMK